MAKNGVKFRKTLALKLTLVIEAIIILAIVTVFLADFAQVPPRRIPATLVTRP